MSMRKRCGDVNPAIQWPPGPPGTCQVGRLVRRPGGPTRWSRLTLLKVES